MEAVGLLSSLPLPIGANIPHSRRQSMQFVREQSARAHECCIRGNGALASVEPPLAKSSTRSTDPRGDGLQACGELARKPPLKPRRRAPVKDISYAALSPSAQRSASRPRDLGAPRAGRAVLTFGRGKIYRKRCRERVVSAPTACRKSLWRKAAFPWHAGCSKGRAPSVFGRSKHLF
jgi:hypothetical protein